MRNQRGRRAQATAVLAGSVGGAVIVRQEIDELAIHFRASAEFDFCGNGDRLCTTRTELLRQS